MYNCFRMRSHGYLQHIRRANNGRVSSKKMSRDAREPDSKMPRGQMILEHTGKTQPQHSSAVFFVRRERADSSLR